MLAMAGGAGEKQPAQVVLTEGAILGGGAFSRVSIVTGVHMAIRNAVWS